MLAFGVKIDRKFIERVATYLLGVAIGLMLLGFIQMQRSQAHQKRLAEEQKAAQATPASEDAGSETAGSADDPGR